MKSIEIELRYEIVDLEQLAPFTDTLTKTNSRRIIDSYLDTEDHDLIRKGVYLRVRNDHKVDIKFNRECLANPDLDMQAHCEDYTFMLPLEEQDLHLFNSIAKTVGLKPLDRPDFLYFKEINNLVPDRMVDKQRASYTKDGFTILIDEVKELGTFLEIEFLAQNTEHLDEITTKMKELLLPLSLKHISTGYDSLIMRKNNFDEYLKSRFILEEDKPLRKQPKKES